MRLLAPLQKIFDETVVTIGNFDGVHRGHQALLAALQEKACQHALPSVVVLFEPQPGEYFYSQQAPARLTSLREKILVLKQCHVDYVYCLRFNKKLACMTPKEFAEHHFFAQLNARHILVGADFRFGKDRLGDTEQLKKIADERGCKVTIFPDFSFHHERVSSTKVRELLALEQFEKASVLLGRTYSLCGRVVVGNKQGRQWGFPTANLSVRRLCLPVTGVFCVQVQRENGNFYRGVANVGCRPTVDGKKNVLEVYLFDFNEMIYGEWLQVFFLHKLRNEFKFPSVEHLINQIHRDVAAAEAFWDQKILEPFPLSFDR